MRVITYKKNIPFQSLFKLDGANDVNAFLNQSNKVFCSSVRTGLLDILDSLNIMDNEFVLLPPICPQGLILPLKRKKIRYKFYHLTDNFKVDISGIESEIKSGACRIVFIIHYFGLFNSQVYELKTICKTSKVLLFEDVVHGFLGKDTSGNELGVVGDISFCSLPKFFPVPDGAVFMLNNKELDIKFNQKENPIHLLSVCFNFLSLNINHAYKKMDNKYLRKFVQLLSKILYSFYYYLLCWSSKNSKMSAISKKILSNIDFKEFIDKKRELFTIYNRYFCYYHDNYIPVTPGYPIINPQINFRNLKSKLNDMDVDALTYIRAWNHIPDDNSFDYERRLIHGHILLPMDIDKMDEYNEHKLNELKTILNETSSSISTIEL